MRGNAASACFLTMLTLLSIEAFETVALVTVDGFNAFSMLAGVILTGS